MKALLALIAMFSISAANAQMYSSANTCAAYTSCYNAYGQVIGQVSCQVYGYQVVQGYGFNANSSCQWGVVHGVGVQCSGYQQVQDAYGNVMFQWQNLYRNCPGY